MGLFYCIQICMEIGPISKVRQVFFAKTIHFLYVLHIYNFRILLSIKKLKKVNMENIYYNQLMNKRNTQATIEFGKRLKKIRKKKGYTQKQLARLMDTSQRMIAHYETQYTRPPLDKITAFANALSVSIEEFLGTALLKEKQEDVSYKIMKKVRVIEKLPIRDQKAIFRLINSLAEKNKVK